MDLVVPILGGGFSWPGIFGPAVLGGFPSPPISTSCCETLSKEQSQLDCVKRFLGPEARLTEKFHSFALKRACAFCSLVLLFPGVTSLRELDCRCDSIR